MKRYFRHVWNSHQILFDYFEESRETTGFCRATKIPTAQVVETTGKGVTKIYFFTIPKGWVPTTVSPSP